MSVPRALVLLFFLGTHAAFAQPEPPRQPTRSALVLPAPLEGLFLVRDAANRAVVEVWKKPGQVLEVGLAPGRYVVHRNRDGAHSQAAVTLSEGERTQLVSWSFAAPRSRPPAPKPMKKGAHAPRARRELKGSAASPVPPRHVLLPLAINIFPGTFSTNLWLASGRPVTNVLALGFVNGGSRLYGIGLALTANAYDERARGILLAGMANNVDSDAAGFQAAGLVNIVEGRFSGLQLTPGSNMAQGGMNGLQVAGFGNGTEQLRGLQVALGGMNLAGDGVWGIQLVGLGANDAEDVTGLQLAGVGNSSRTLTGIQAALFGNAAFEGVTGLQVSLVNVGGDVTGAQVGLLNIADTVRGTQLGLLNFSKVMKGVPLGLFSFEEGAPFHLETWASDIQLVNVGVKFGGRSTYTTLMAGVGPDDRLQRYSLGLGLGGRVSLGRRFWLEADVAGSVVRLRGQPLLGGANVLGQGRLMLGLQLFEHLALFAGPTYNTYFSWSEEDRNAPTTLPVRVYQVDPDITLQHWPGMQLGLRI